MKKSIHRPHGARNVFRRKSIAARVTAGFMAGFAGLIAGQSAQAMELSDPGSDWSVRLDNTISYGVGMRAKDADPLIANSPTHAQGDNKFSKAGDIVTNRVSLSTELEAVYEGRMGFRISGSGWYDAAYNGKAAGTPYPSNYSNNEYSDYTKRQYEQGGELLDAFVFDNFDISDHPTTVKFGRLVQYWGNAQFFNSHGISFGQSASDLIKGSSAPATPAKELTLPRGQLNVSTQLTPTLSLAGQYFFEYAPDRLPEGGTFLGPADFGFQGPDRFGATGMLNAGLNKPKNTNNNGGLALRWSPDWAEGTIGFYARHLDETSPWLLFGQRGANAVYSPTYAQGTNLYGMSYDRNIYDSSAGFEVSYRQHTGLDTASGSAAAFNANEGARGNVLNAVANTFISLDRSRFYDTGTIIAELAYQHLFAVTDNAAMFNGVGTAACGPNGLESGCASKNSLSAALLISPQWLQALPSVDISMPIFAMYGVAGNTATLGAPVMKGDLTASFGVTATVQKVYNFGLTYNFYNGPTNGQANVPGIGDYYAGGNNMYQNKDKDWVSLTFSTTF
jgi:hypothetical protein